MVALACTLPNIELKGLHFHIGSQITENEPFVMLCETINRLQDEYESRGITFSSINLGGGLGIDYAHPERHPIPDFEGYFTTFHNHLHIRPDRSSFRIRPFSCRPVWLAHHTCAVCQGRNYQKFAIVDAGMSDLIRPALYNAHHKNREHLQS